VGGRATSIVLLIGVALTTAIFSNLQAQPLGCDRDWAGDPRLLAPTTEGLEDLLPSAPEEQSVTGFGELLGDWTWTDLGIPGSYAGAGLSIDYPYLYLANQDYHRVYVLDISTGAPTPVLWVSAPGNLITWSMGMDNDQELWVGEAWYNYSWAYEMTSYPPAPTATGNAFNSYQGGWFIADISDNAPYDTLYAVCVGFSNRNIFAFHEPGGEVGRNFGDTTWNYTTQRALAYNEDDGTLFIGGWFSARIWEISLSDGAPLPGKNFYAPDAAGAAYQRVADGGPCLWVQSNSEVDVLRKYRVGPVDSCRPVEPWKVKSQGYWRRQCKDDGHEDICAYVDSVHTLADLFDAYDCDSICDLMNVNPPENDMCRKARRQFMALLLNVASGKLAVCNCLEDSREVAEALAEIDSLLSGDPDFRTCEYAKTLADNLNNGIGIVPCDSFWAQAPPKVVQPPSVSVAPNPFAKSTVIEYEIKSPGRVRLDIYDKAGRLVRTLVDAEQPVAPHRVEWDGFDSSMRQVPAGVYFSRLELGNCVSSAKLVLLR
jgi:hypothetical protein